MAHILVQGICYRGIGCICIMLIHKKHSSNQGWYSHIDMERLFLSILQVNFFWMLCNFFHIVLYLCIKREKLLATSAIIASPQNLPIIRPSILKIVLGIYGLCTCKCTNTNSNAAQSLNQHFLIISGKADCYCDNIWCY